MAFACKYRSASAAPNCRYQLPMSSGIRRLILDVLTKAECFFMIGIRCMVVQHLGTMGEACRPSCGTDLIHVSPQWFKDFADGDTGMWNVRCAIAEQTFFFVTMDMEGSNSAVDLEVTRQQMADALVKMTKILTEYVVD